MYNTGIYEDIAKRTGGDIYIGVVGPVRCGKSTFIKKFMDCAVIPNISDENERRRTVDELPQSAGGKTVMTTEPKFIPERSVKIEVGKARLNVKMIDCVGYMIEGAEGDREGDEIRQIKTPWSDELMPFDIAAETGTNKVITEHSTVGVLVSCDGSFGDLPRESFIPAEERIVSELKALGKPFVLVLNSKVPDSEEAEALALELEEKYKVPVALVNCTELDARDIEHIIGMLTFEFPICEIDFSMPDWTTGLPEEHWLTLGLVEEIKKIADSADKLYDVAYLNLNNTLSGDEKLHVSAVTSDINLGEGRACVKISLEETLFYKIIEELSGFVVTDKGDLLKKLRELAEVKSEYEKYKDALDEVERLGYGIVMPKVSEMELDKPEIVKHQGAYGVRLHACAPSIHLIKTNIETEINPVVGTEQQSEDIVKYLLSGFENDPESLWNTNLFGKTLHELVNEGLHAKLSNMPQDARAKIGETLSRVINEGSSGLICIIL